MGKNGGSSPRSRYVRATLLKRVMETKVVQFRSSFCWSGNDRKQLLVYEQNKRVVYALANVAMGPPRDLRLGAEVNVDDNDDRNLLPMTFRHRLRQSPILVRAPGLYSHFTFV